MENKSELYVLGIVAVIAVIGILAMFISTSTPVTRITTQNADKIGYAVSVNTAARNNITNGTNGTATSGNNTGNSTYTYCYDTDGGYNYNQKGTINGQLSGSSYTYTDYCMTNYGNNVTLKEYVCQYNQPNSVNYNCTNGCYNGACITQNNTAWCIDSDGGINPNIKGFVNTNTGITWVDTCNSNSTNTLREGGCQNNTLIRLSIICTTGCYDGACIVTSNNSTNVTSNATN